MRIGIAYSLKPDVRGDVDGPDDRYEEFDKPETVAALADVLRGEGHEVVLLGDGRAFLARVLDDPPDFVWNFAEGEGIGRSREARVPAVLEMLGVPYSGSDPLTLAAALDKEIARRLVQGHVTVPPGRVLPPDATPEEARVALLPLRDAYPLIVKPAFEGSSKGIRARCLVENEEDAVSIFRQLARDYEQPILVEQFIDGDEVTVGLLGNGEGVQVLGAMRILPKRRPRPFIYSLDVKRDWANQVEYESPARLSAGLLGQLVRKATDAYRLLGCRDVARIDFRVRNDIAYFLEANPLPGLAPVTSDLVILAEGYGIGHADLIRRILNAALTRVGLARPELVAS